MENSYYECDPQQQVWNARQRGNTLSGRICFLGAVIRVFAGLTLWWTVLEVSLVFILVENVFGLLAIVFALLRELPFSGGLLSTVTGEEHMQ